MKIKQNDMINIPLLDSNRLINIKQRHGISISTGSSTSVYLLSRKIKRGLKEKLKPYYKYEMDLDIQVEKLLSKFNSTDICMVFLDYVETTSPDILYQETSKLRPFLSKMKKELSKLDKKAKEDDSDDEWGED